LLAGDYAEFIRETYRFALKDFENGRPGRLENFRKVSKHDLFGSRLYLDPWMTVVVEAEPTIDGLPTP
jgi:hypothetical protein